MLQSDILLFKLCMRFAQCQKIFSTHVVSSAGNPEKSYVFTSLGKTPLYFQYECCKVHATELKSFLRVSELLPLEDFLEKFREFPKFRETWENVGKFSPGKFREIFPRIFRDFQGMKLMLQP